MGVLVDADALIKALNLAEWFNLADFNEAVYTVRKAQPVDAVPVVRCKDCKFFSHGYCRFHDAKFVRPDGYCYWGEQKEGEQHD